MDDVPFLHGGPLGYARFKTVPEDFLVEELLGFEPSGEGEHCLVWVEKRDLESNTAGAMLADSLGIRRRHVSHCGLKDRHAVTRQWFSLHMPGQPSPDPEQMEAEGLRILRITRNLRKLRRGFHTGNRFTIRLRGLDFDPALARERWDQITKRGVPNIFGQQRFGREGRNVEKAVAMFRGDYEPRERLVRGLLLSSARSHLFNAVVAARLEQGTWDQAQDGEVFGFNDNRTILLPERHRGDEAERFQNGLVELTAPMWGSGELPSASDVKELEAAVAGDHPEVARGLEAAGLRQQRRVMRVRPAHPEFQLVEEDIVLTFDLPRGCYATALLREMVE